MYELFLSSFGNQIESNLAELTEYLKYWFNYYSANIRQMQTNTDRYMKITEYLSYSLS